MNSSGFKSAFLTFQSGALYKNWKSQNSGEATKLQNFASAVFAGQNPAAPVLSSITGKGLVGMLNAVKDEYVVITPPPPPTPPDPVKRSAQVMYAELETP